MNAQFIIHFSPGLGDTTSDALVAFLDARRLGRIRLVPSPLECPPISTLGFDPLLNMPSFDDFYALARKRSCPIKALLLDQAFSAGVGNWVADEILYHARIHPEQKANGLDVKKMKELYKWVEEVPRKAVEVNADDKLFPEDWLFKHRWDKGKKKKKPKKGEDEIVEDSELKLVCPLAFLVHDGQSLIPRSFSHPESQRPSNGSPSADARPRTSLNCSVSLRLLRSPQRMKKRMTRRRKKLPARWARSERSGLRLILVTMLIELIRVREGPS
jgi:hypothetical protein